MIRSSACVVALSALLMSSLGSPAQATVTRPSRSSRVATPADVDAVIARWADRLPRLPRDRRAASVARGMEGLSSGGKTVFEVIAQRVTRDSAAQAQLRATDPAAAQVLDAALVQVLGLWRDPAALPVLRSFWKRPLTDRHALQAGADALGRLCTPEAVSLLSNHVVATGDGRRLFAARGLGLCRTEAAARVLLDGLERAQDGAGIEALAEALGMLGSSWAWEALGPARAAEGVRLRRSCAAGLERAAGRVTGDAAAAVDTARRMVGPVEAGSDSMPLRVPLPGRSADRP